MSLSAPELGSDAPIFNPIRNSASSTELLHERAMMRLYQACEAEKEHEKEHSTQILKSDIPKIQINSKDSDDIVGLERRNSGRRLSSGGINQKQILWAQRRHSLKNPSELKDDTFSKLHKFPQSADEKRNLLLNKQRSESEEREEELFEEARKRPNSNITQEETSNEKHKVNIAEVEKWADDYESSTDDNESESSEDERKEVINRFKPPYSDEDEVETYHPGGVRASISSVKDPFEILTVRKDPPSPDFVPKPILKKIEHDDPLPMETVSQPTLPPRSPPKSPQSQLRTRALSPIPSSSPQRDRSLSLTTDTLTSNPTNIKSAFEQHPPPTKPRQRSFSLLPQKDLLSKKVDKLETLNKPRTADTTKTFSMLSSIAECAKISGITAASIVIPDTLLEKQKDAEEAKVVIDHYGDIVKNYGNRRKSNPQINTNKNIAGEQQVAMKVIETNVSSGEDNVSKELPITKTSLMDHYDITSQTNRLSNRNGTRRESESNIDKTKNLLNAVNLNYNQTTTVTTPKSDVVDIPQLNDHHNRESLLDKSSAFVKINPVFHNTPIDTSATTKTEFESNSSYLSNSCDLQRTGDAIENISLSKNKEYRKTAPSPIRKINPSPIRKTDPSPIRKTGRKTSPSPMRISNKKTVSQSPLRKDIPVNSNLSNRKNSRPMLREIMTQTSEDPYIYDSDLSRASTPPFRTYEQEELIARAEIKVRSFVDYVTDLAMFAVACWLYFFSNELYAIPVLLIMVYRQLQEEISKRIPQWIKRRFKGKKNKKQ